MVVSCTTKKLRRGAHRAVADQIRESITRYCTRIDESGH